MPPNDSDHPQQLFEADANSDSERASYVRRMFGDISGRYDLMNTLMTAGRHHAWRRLAAQAIVRPGDSIVDAGCGTGDLAFACVEAGAQRVTGIDFAPPMVGRARAKAAERGALYSRRTTFSVGDATRLPLADASVDGWCSAFVMRNIPNLDGALSEARRVLRPGGRLAVLEIPRLEGGAIRPFARVHFQHVIPRVGRLISGHRSAYTYLPVSVDHFLTPAEFSDRLWHAGFEVTQVRRLMFGTVALHVAEKREL